MSLKFRAKVHILLINENISTQFLNKGLKEAYFLWITQSIRV
jgi:hypothetical protein